MPFCSADCLALTTCLATVLLPATPALAQLELIPDTAPDRTVGTQVIQNGLPGSDVITGGTRSHNGQNLFHSFQEFNIRENRGVYFQNPAGVQNILTRVTGNAPSNVLGTLGVLGTANLFFLNPNGIIFGPNARLDIRGSFFASTANSFKLADGSEFSATNPQAPPLLTVNITPGLQTGTLSPSSTITNRGTLSTGQDLVLEGDRLDLQGQLVAGRDLTLKAQDAIQIRDTVTVPFLAQSARNLTIQGNQAVDIFALNHPNSELWSGGNLVLRSANAIVGDAHYVALGNIQFEQLNGQPGTLISPHDPILRSLGDVVLGSYRGRSLHIFAGGSVTITGLIDIRGADPVNGIVETIPLSNGRSIAINGRTTPTVDIRAGLDPSAVGVPLGSTGTASVTEPAFITDSPSSADITVGTIFTPAATTGLVFLTNQYRPNPSLRGDIRTGRIDGSILAGAANGSSIVIDSRGSITFDSIDASNQDGGNGGRIELIANGDIRNTGALDLPFPSPVALSTFSLSIVDSGNGGNIALTSREGNIRLENGGARSTSTSLFFGDAGNGGTISFTTQAGAITLINSQLDSQTLSGLGNAGNGGSISFNTQSGTISLTNSNSNSLSSSSDTAGEGGAISFTTQSGNITLTGTNLESGSKSDSGRAGNGGAISFTTQSGDVTLTNSFSLSISDSGVDSGNGGAISVNTQSGNINLINAVLNSFSGAGLNSGNGGAISVNTQSGNINLVGAVLDSTTTATKGRGGVGGAISLNTESGNITLTNSTSNSSSSSDLDSSNGGAISLNTQSGNISLTNSDLSSFSFSFLGKARNGGAISFTTQSGNISLIDLELFSPSISAFGNASTGGAISLNTQSGSLSLKNSLFLPYSFADAGNAGNGGAISLSAGGSFIAGGASSLNSSSVSLQGGSGEGGKVTLEAKRGISALTVNTIASDGKSGNVQINGNGNLALDQINIVTAQQVEVCFRPPCSASKPPTTVNLGSRGQAGDVRIDSSGDLTFRNSIIQSDTRSGNPAGNITITSPGVVSFNDSQFSSNTSGSGKAGDISINAPVVNLTAQSQIQAQTTETSSGSGGSITINAPTAVALTRTADGNPVISVKTSGAGKAGDITINTPLLILSDAAEITATATQSSTSPEGGGSITLNTSNLNLAGVVGVFAETQGQAPAGTLNLMPYNNQADLNIALTPNSQISASTSGSGNGGDLIMSAPRSITIAGRGKLAVETNSTGNAGNMTITTSQLSLNDGVELSASTFGEGRAGEVQINADTLTIEGGARILTNTSGIGQAGDLIVNVIDRLLLTDPDTGLFASTTPGSTGNGGNIIVDPRFVQIGNGATIAVNSQGSGTGGSISLRAGRLELRDRGSITAETASAQGGNITLEVQDLMLLRRNSLISATAGTGQTVGDGGNITIRAGFVIGVLGENSDITANAFTGRGGNISISTNAIFGLLPQARLTPLSDITASSEFGLSGTIAITDLNVDPNRGLVALPTNLTDTSRQIREDCTPGSAAVARKNSFVVTGRGGLPVSPEATQTGDRPLVNLVSLMPNSATQASLPPASSVSTNLEKSDEAAGELVEAQAWIQGKNGEVYLIAHANTASLHQQGLASPACSSR